MIGAHPPQMLLQAQVEVPAEIVVAELYLGVPLSAACEKDLLVGVIARIKGIYTANGRFRGNMDSKISKYQSKYGEAGIHGLALALEDKYGQSPSSAAASSGKRKRPRQYLRIGEAQNPGPPPPQSPPRSRIQNQECAAYADSQRSDLSWKRTREELAWWKLYFATVLHAM